MSSHSELQILTRNSRLSLFKKSLTVGSTFVNVLSSTKHNKIMQATNPTLQLEARSSKVREMKELLNRWVSRDFKVTVNDIFDAETERSVKAFQFSRMLKSDGIVGAKTWKSLVNNSLADVPVPSLRLNSKGDSVAIVQGVLKSSFYKGAVDGVFGPSTEAAVKAFQKEKNLTVDGVVGAKTWAAFDGLAKSLAFD